MTFGAARCNSPDLTADPTRPTLTISTGRPPQSAAAPLADQRPQSPSDPIGRNPMANVGSGAPLAVVTPVFIPAAIPVLDPPG